MGTRDRIEPFTRAEGTREAKRPQRILPGRLRRLLPSIVLVAAAVVVLSSTQSDADVDVENMWAAVAFLLFAGGVTAWVWRKARADGFEALRWRRLHRRVFWRAAAVCLLAGLVSLWFDAFWQWRADNSPGVSQLPVWEADSAHAHFFAGLSGWLAFAAAPLVVIEPFAWRLWPRPMRMAVRRAQVAKILSERKRMTRLELDTALGAIGRPGSPRAFDTVQPCEASSEVHRISPKGRRPAAWTRAASDSWWRNAAIAWDGDLLVLTDAQGRSRAFATVSRPRAAGGSGKRLVAEIVWFMEERYYRGTAAIVSTRPTRQTLLLDAEGRRIAEMPGFGFAAGDLADLARSAGLPFAAYDLGSSWQDERMANQLLFPRTWRTVKIAPPRRAGATG